jgi:hypothetical protein
MLMLLLILIAIGVFLQPSDPNSNDTGAIVQLVIARALQLTALTKPIVDIIAKRFLRLGGLTLPFTAAVVGFLLDLGVLLIGGQSFTARSVAIAAFTGLATAGGSWAVTGIHDATRDDTTKIVPVLILCAALVFTQTACPGAPSETQINRAAKASLNISRYTATAITLVDTFYTNGQLSIAQKDVFAIKLRDFSKAGSDFNALVKQFSDQYQSGSVPANVWAQINASFTTVERMFLDILTLIPQAAGLQNSKQFQAIASAVLAVAQILMSVAALDGRYTRSIYDQLRKLNIKFDSDLAYANAA